MPGTEIVAIIIIALMLLAFAISLFFDLRGRGRMRPTKAGDILREGRYQL